MGHSHSKSPSTSADDRAATHQKGDDHHTKSQSSQQKEGMIRSASGADINEKSITHLVSIEKLAEILKKRSSEVSNVNGIITDVFVTQVFPNFSDLGQRLFKHLHLSSKAQTDYLGTLAFRQQCERFLGILDDSVALEIYVRMFSEPERPDFITKLGVMNLLLTCFRVAMSNYSGKVRTCPFTDRTLTAVVKSIFFTQECLSIGFVCRWLEQNCIRLVLLMHKYCVHTLSTAYRILEQGSSTSDYTQSFGLELSTPVLDQTNPFPDKPNDNTLMALSQAWLLAGALPLMYSKPQVIAAPRGSNGGGGTGGSPSHATTMGSTSATQSFKEKFSLIPSHWTLLYDSNQHGVGANRFLHHVLGYRGPTLVLLHTKDEQTYCIAAPTEWKETHLYIGGEESCVVQLQPKFVHLEKGSKILYLNTSIRGYPKGLRAGVDPKKPVISVDENFEKVDCKGLQAILYSIEVWGCGDKTSREVQLDFKKWQIKEAERQRTVKLTAADWMDHPDRYLLELGGRPNYNN